MAVETVYGTYTRAGYQATPKTQGDPRFSARFANSHLEETIFPAASSVGSTGYFGRFPKTAIMDPTSRIFWTAAGASATLNIGDANDPDGIATVIDISAAGNALFMEAVTADDLLKPLWEILGYATEDAAPDMIDLYASLAGAASSAGFTVTYALRWLD